MAQDLGGLQVPDMRGVISSHEYADAVSLVTRALRALDPLGLGAEAGDTPASEYEPEAAEIVRKLGRSEAALTVPEATTVIEDVFRAAFGQESVEDLAWEDIGTAVVDALSTTP